MLQAGLSPAYVLDEMEMYEIRTILDNLYLRYKEDWERTRFAAYVTAQGNSKKRLKPSDILRFPWEEGKKPARKRKTVAHQRGGTDRIKELMEKIIKEDLI